MTEFTPYLTKQGGMKATQPIQVKSQWFLHKQVEAHGTRYDYSEVVYAGALTKVRIICKVHGVFEQTPQSHTRGRGCPKCQGLQTKTTQECISDFQKVHGDLYEYSQVRYQGSHSNVYILCKHHGGFSQQPANHLSGQGCPKCKNHNQDTIYFAKCLNTGLIKIGVTNNITKRIVEIGGNLNLLHYFKVPNPKILEKSLHKKYSQLRRYNCTVRNGNTEFFVLTEQQLQSIIEEIR